MDLNLSQMIDEAVEACFESLVEIRRHLHMNPDPSGEEEATTQYLVDLFSDKGFSTQKGLDERGLLIELGDSNSSSAESKVAIRADIDALWIQDTKEVEYKSQREGILHACGHDAHSATVAGAAFALRELEDRDLLPWPVAWRGIFQPAEEICQGARDMISAGALKNVKHILSTHVDPTLKVGMVGLRKGVLTAAVDEVHIEIIGQGGHAARPHESVDPIAAAAQLVSSIYLFVPRAVSSSEPVVVTFGEIQGGHNANVIPDKVTLRGTLRTLSPATRQSTQDHIQKLALGIAETSGAEILVRFPDGAPSVYNDPSIYAVVEAASLDVVGADQIYRISHPSMGGEDFAFYLEQAPGCMFRIGSSSIDSPAPPLHSSLFDVDERAIAVGAKILTRSVIELCRPQ